MKKRYEDIAQQFIPKHSHKYLMRKTLVNTKFQWLMKYISQENEEPITAGWKFSRAAHFSSKLQAKEKQPELILQQKTLNADTSTLQHKPQERDQTIKTTQSATLKRHIRSRISTQPTEEAVFMEKSKFKNKSLLMHRSKSRKIPLLFQKQFHSTETEKSKNISCLQRSKTGDVRRGKVALKQNFALTPWALPEDNQENNDLLSYF